MDDSRLHQLLALIGDAGDITDELIDENVGGEHLAAAAQFLAGAANHTRALLPRCDREPLGGGRCVLHRDHAGDHYRPWPDRDGGFTWSDGSQTKLYEKWGSGRD